ncbi:nitrate- and nitrite sensing domain-containing protein [Streptomyces sp. TRM 70361]|uniref:sensor histidine kinase n=1 Tax=Streptomyces sp. TRM 70361 TaxID=3116553 RepID=UPI002E7B3476|nr:nitrate- and nitrite sensing domain-containing protein [Streptomyces sp. TRM 70361]MEE1938620.1 nitrate- and nitrite sensing domain-containing protein [Streptomyces sp. TRM 70361]
MQGRFKRDDSAVGDPELRGASDRGSSPQRAQESGGREQALDTDGGMRPNAQPDGEPDGGKPKGPVSTGSRLALRNWSINTRLVSLLALPVVAATSLGALRINSSLTEVEQLDSMKLLTDMTEHATELAAALQEERDNSAGPLTGTGNPKDEAVVGPREGTDQVKVAFFDAAGQIADAEDDTLSGVRATVTEVNRQLNRLKTIRDRAYENPNNVSQTVNDYNQLIESLLNLSQDMAQATSNPEMIKSTRALAAFSSAKEYASMQRAIISAGLAHEDGPKLSENDHLFLRSAWESESAARKRFTEIYGGGEAAELTKPLDEGIVNITSADQYAERVVKDPEGISRENRSYLDWFDQDRVKIEQMSKIEESLLTQMDEEARRLRANAQQAALVNGVLVLLVLGISLVGAFVVARSMVRSLRRLQDTAQEVAHRRLPELVKQLSEADPQDVDTSVKSVGVHSRDEIGRVAAAFDDVHREAVRLAAEQALLRGNVNAMFTNLSRRSQGLIQRQLSLISELESREADPDQLSSLFKLDHLATRMRRNGENLLVLAGEEPGRRWTRPVPLVDVLRAAASEVEQYERIELSSVPTTEVAGRVVNDLVHLLAELLENATSFSSPQTKVKVTGHALPDGRVLVEIHDTGIGLSPEDLAAINERLANPPTVDVSVSRRMGLFVVGRLSLRHGIRIQLRPSDSGGTTALVMLPVDVTQRDGQPKKPGAGADNGQGTPPSATLRREPQGGGGTQSGTSRLGGLPTRNQVQGGGSSRAALPGGGAPAGGGFGAPPRPAGQPGQPGQSPRHGAGAPTAGAGAMNAFGSEARPEPSGNRFPQRDGGPAGELPPGSDDRRPSWADGPRDRMPGPHQVSDAPRGHEEAGATGEYARPDWGGAYQPSAGLEETAQFPRLEPNAGPQETGQFPRPQGPQETGQFPRPQGPQETGQFPRPQGPQETGQFPRPQAPAPQPTGQYTPQQGFPAPQSGAGYELPGSSAAAVGSSERTPIFESVENNWFSSRRAAQEAASSGPATGDSRSMGASRPQPEAGGPAPAAPASSAPAPQPPRREPAIGGERNGGAAAGGWQDSPNDERWRRAEQLRQPASGGVTTSGLPRRVPRANLVAGTAQQRQTAPAGPQVSRAPADVRGRLTNLRRGIQQGRQAGNGQASGSRGTGPTYQQER